MPPAKPSTTPAADRRCRAASRCASLRRASSRTRVLALALVTAGLTGLVPARPLAAQVSLGLQASHGDKSDLGLGARAVVDLGPFDAGFRLVGSFDLFFPGAGLLREVARESGVTGVPIEGDADYWELNVNLLYTLGLLLVPVTPYVGGGLNVARTEVRRSPGGQFDVERSDKGLNALAGVVLDVGGVSPFFEIRYEINGGEQWVVTGGIVF